MGSSVVYYAPQSVSYQVTYLFSPCKYVVPVLTHTGYNRHIDLLHEDD